jgi:hypothetical protein
LTGLPGHITSWQVRTQWERKEQVKTQKGKFTASPQGDTQTMISKPIHHTLNRVNGHATHTDRK